MVPMQPGFQMYYGGARMPYQPYPQGQYVQPNPTVVYRQTGQQGTGGHQGQQGADGLSQKSGTAQTKAPEKKRKSKGIVIKDPNSDKILTFKKPEEPKKEPKEDEAASAAKVDTAASEADKPAGTEAKLANSENATPLTPNTVRKSKAIRIVDPSGADVAVPTKPKDTAAPTKTEAAAAAEPTPTAAPAAAFKAPSVPISNKQKRKAALARADASTASSMVSDFTDEGASKPKLEVTVKPAAPNVIPSGKPEQKEEDDKPEADDDWEEANDKPVDEPKDPAMGSGPQPGPGQWTPFNQTGSRSYPMEYLKAFDAVCKQPPPNFRTDINQIMSAGEMSRNSNKGKFAGGDFKNNVPNWMVGENQGAGRPGQGQRRDGGRGGGPMDFRGQRDPRGGPRGGRDGGRDFGRGSQGGGGGRKSGGVIKLPPRGDTTGTLKKAADGMGWKGGKNKDPKEAKDLTQQAIAMLNKITPEKFDTLSQKILKLIMQELDKVSDFVQVIFEKAIDESFFSAIYAQLCHFIADAKVSSDKDAEPCVTGFRKKLLDQCQKQFEKAATDEAASNAKEKKDKEAQGTEAKENEAKEEKAKENDTKDKDPSENEGQSKDAQEQATAPAEAKKTKKELEEEAFKKREAEREEMYQRNKVSPQLPFFSWYIRSCFV